jgi:CubicO group peptidase (beta-lactamase class C family)
MASNYIHNNNVAKDPSEYNLVFWLIGPTFNFDNSAEAKILEIKSRFPQASLVMVKTGDVADLPFVEMPSGLDALVVSPSNLPFTWSALAQAVFSGINVNSKHNNTNIPKPLNQSSLSLTATRLKYGIPEEVGLISDSLMLINGIVEDAIRKTAIPGAQVLVAKNGVVVFNKNFGWVTYDKNRMVTGDIIYDLASITKVMATLPVLMQQYDRGSWHLNNKLSDFIPEADTTDKGKITMRQLLLHESGLPAFISFYIEAIDRTKLSGTLFSNRRSPTHTLRLEDRLFLNKSVAYRDDVFQAQHDLKFSVPVAKNLFMNVFYQDSMFYRILKSKTDLVVKYRYSDLNFMLLQRISENITKESLEVQANINFYKPIGASSLCFNPWKTIPLDQVAPTENDQVFRHQLLHGYVHDPGAAMMGGIAGHAGLFGNASDLAKMAQMYLNNGVYGGARFINEETMMLFTSQQNQANRRGLGFDKPENIPENNSSVTQLVSPLSYGHTGFSGTIVWIDPEYDLIFIFLSNRIHPNSYNKKILELGIRPRVQRAVYQSIKDRIPTN